MSRFFLAVLSFLSGLGFVLAMGAGLMWLWAPVTQPRSPHHVAEGVSESASVARSQASRPDVVVDVGGGEGPRRRGHPLSVPEGGGNPCEVADGRQPQLQDDHPPTFRSGRRLRPPATGWRWPRGRRTPGTR